jgi:hypothetical protein
MEAVPRKSKKRRIAPTASPVDVHRLIDEAYRQVPEAINYVQVDVPRLLARLRARAKLEGIDL